MYIIIEGKVECSVNMKEEKLEDADILEIGRDVGLEKNI
jgi:hypothetical protein